MRTPLLPAWFRTSMVLFATGSAATAAGCSSTGSNADIAGSFPYCGPAASCPASVEGVDLDAPVVSFQNDVFPIFQQSCNDTACHGSTNNPAGELYLGPESATPSSAELANVVSALITTPSAIGPEGTLGVVAGDWQKSFLMLKVDGCQNDVGLDCSGDAKANQDSACDPPEPCGDGMPQLDQEDADSLGTDPFPLGEDQRHTIRRWIHQGAQNN